MDNKPYRKHQSSTSSLIDDEQASVESKKKWKCGQCTYENWPSASKCTICLCAKSSGQLSHSLSSALSTSFQNLSCSAKAAKKGVAKRASAKTQIELVDCQKKCGDDSGDPTGDKWSCSVCTYLNWPKSSKCVQCCTPKLHDGDAKQRQQSGSPKNSPLARSLCNSPVPDQELGADKKWPCAACTYQNWPKSQRCIMCHVPRMGGQSQAQNSKKTIKLVNLKQLNYQIQMDRLFLAACQGIADSDMSHLNRYIHAGGDLTRYLTADECKLLNRPQVFTVGLTILHLCYQFKRKELLIKLLNKTANLNHMKQNAPKYKVLNSLLKQFNKTKFSPCQSCPSLASNIIDRYFTANLRQKKTSVPMAHSGPVGLADGATSSLMSLGAAAPSSLGATSLPQHGVCFHVNDSHTFTLPNELEDFAPKIQHVLFDELLDREVQKELEFESRIINWNVDICKRLNSSLYPLWNRHSGDCLLDSVFQACYGVFDTDNILRRVMAESLEQYAAFFKPRWKEHEILMANALNYRLDDCQLDQDWNNILSLANQPGASLEQAHIFALCHVFRRPIVVYSVKYVKSFRGENIGFTHFEGVYLPLIWEASFCFKSPIALGYTKGHFTALVALDRPDIFMPINVNSSNNPGNVNIDNLNCSSSANSNSSSSTSSNANSSTSNMLGAVSAYDHINENQNQTFYLPLTNSDGKLLPVHFLTTSEIGRERSILRQYLNLDCLVLSGSNCGLIVAQQRV
ncbi:Ubiquitin thioesterase Zranb1, partial [Brachionus plicatilis]